MMNQGFRLQRVMRYRDDMKSLACMELSRRIQNLNFLKEELTQLKLEEDALLKHYSVQGEKLDTGMINLFHSYFALLQNSCAAKEGEIADSLSEVESQRDEVIQAWREHRKLEHLQEQFGESVCASAKKQEQRLHDEICVRMYGDAKGPLL
jgi:flagellar export protein FliJ